MAALAACRFDDVPSGPIDPDRPDGGEITTPEADAPRPVDAAADRGADLATPPDLVPDLPDEASAAPDGAPETAAETAPEPAPDLASPVDPLVIGLVARWRYDEGMGAVASDATGNGNLATLHNGVGWQSSGVPGAGAGDFALQIDGVDDFVSTQVTTIPALHAAKTIAFWLAADRSVGLDDEGQRSCVSLFSEAPRGGVQVGFDRGRPAAWLRGADRGLIVTGGVPGPGFHHFAYSYDGRTHRLWIDGREVGSADGPAPPMARITQLFVGTYEVPSEMCPGLFDELRIYDRALLPDEVRDLARPRTSTSGP
jgi:hypothetical protein